jgi:hypothetical protein
MDRRNILSGVLAAAGGLFAAAGATRAKAAPVTPDKAKVAYHVSELEKVQFVLGNIKNHFDGVGGPEHVTIELVVHGPALKAFHAETANPDNRARVADFTKRGLRLAACIHSMHGQKVELKDLLPGFTVADKGGVVRLAELQAMGYVYLRP